MTEIILKDEVYAIIGAAIELIIHVAEKIPETILQEDPKLLMWYDQTKMIHEVTRRYTKKEPELRVPSCPSWIIIKENL